MALFRKLDFKSELGTPKNIGLATKHTFLGLELPELVLDSQIAPLAPLWRIGALYGRQNGPR